MVTGTSQQDRVYTFRLLNGGYVESVTRNGEALDVEEHADEVLVKACLLYTSMPQSSHHWAYFRGQTG